MPFDFKTYQHYSINYTNLFNELNYQKIFDNPSIQTQYLLLWMKVLNDHDKIITNQLNTQKSILEMELNLQSEREIFQHTMNYSNTKVLLHFRASIANEIILSVKSKNQFIPINEFIKEDSEFKWTPVDTNVDSYSNAKDPIIIVPFLNNQYRYLVIDGNHRLTYKTQKYIDNINSIVISERTVIEQSLFSSSFDMYYYILQNEISHMINEAHYKNATANDLIQKSYLTEGAFKFY